MTNTRPTGVDPVVAAVNAAIGEGAVGVACSGGADSMALLRATIEVAGASRVVAIVVDHGLSDGSARVAEEVAAWARGQGARAVVRRVEVEDRASVEAAAREARYRALREVAGEAGVQVVLVGHTARDQAETVLMRIVRGTGPAGLGGMEKQATGDRLDATAADRVVFARPLLELSRDEIERYVRAHALPTWPDPMNADRDLFRVRVREELLPALRRENPQIDAALLRLAETAREWTDVIDHLAEPYARLPLDCVELALQQPAVRKRALAIALEREDVAYDAVHLEALDALVVRASAGTVSLDLPEAKLVRTYDQLDLARPLDAPPLAAPEGHVLRRWQPGDRMRPARLNGRSKKLSDLFIDAKIPRERRAAARVLVRVADGAIVWAEHLGLAHGEAEAVAPMPPE